MSDQGKLRDIQLALSTKLDQIQRLWDQPTRVTLVLRDPANTEMEVVIGDDGLDEAIAAIQRAKARPPVEGDSK